MQMLDVLVATGQFGPRRGVLATRESSLFGLPIAHIEMALRISHVHSLEMFCFV